MNLGTYWVEDVTAPDNLDAKVSEHFKLLEFKCNDNSRVVVLNSELVAVLEMARRHFGKDIKINSGYRTVAYNSTLKNSSPNCYWILNTITSNVLSLLMFTITSIALIQILMV